MKKDLNKFIVLCGFLTLAITAKCQEILNLHFEQSGKQIIIYYDLNGERKSTCNVYLFCSGDGGETWGDTLKMITGDAGLNIPVGTGKKIIWDVLKERDDLTGNIKFKIIAASAEFSGNTGVFKDKRDGKSYKWVRLGSQLWMAENLNIGKMIKSEKDQSDNRKIEKYCLDNLLENCNKCGGLYQWNELMNYTDQAKPQGICPSGWHIPSNSECNELKAFLGRKNEMEVKLKFSKDGMLTLREIDPNLSGFNPVDCGIFNISRQGVRDFDSGGYFYSEFWSSDGDGFNRDKLWEFYNDGTFISYGSLGKNDGLSCRCIKD